MSFVCIITTKKILFTNWILYITDNEKGFKNSYYSAINCKS